jgi:hypothetical protein
MPSAINPFEFAFEPANLDAALFFRHGEKNKK